MVPAPQNPRSEEWAWTEGGRSTQCRRGDAPVSITRRDERQSLATAVARYGSRSLRRPVFPLTPLGCDSDTTACCPPQLGPPAALGQTRSRVARHERGCDLDDSERAGGEEAAARATTSPAKTCKTCSANRPTSYHHHHAADVKASLIGAGVVPCGGVGTRQYEVKAWS